jgi:ElaB/YqjD/DUF883 family membrane-anchored ribosome-binding protein
MEVTYMATSTSAARNTASRGEDDVANIEQNIERLRGDISALAQSISRYGADKTGEYKDRANKAGNDLAQASKDTLDSLTAELNDLERAVSTRVRDKPLQALGIAAGIGFLVAFLARR